MLIIDSDINYDNIFLHFEKGGHKYKAICPYEKINLLLDIIDSWRDNKNLNFDKTDEMIMCDRISQYLEMIK